MKKIKINYFLLLFIFIFLFVSIFSIVDVSKKNESGTMNTDSLLNLNENWEITYDNKTENLDFSKTYPNNGSFKQPIKLEFILSKKKKM